jgi:hypothetical protein
LVFLSALLILLILESYNPAYWGKGRFIALYSWNRIIGFLGLVLLRFLCPTNLLDGLVCGHWQNKVKVIKHFINVIFCILRS